MVGMDKFMVTRCGWGRGRLADLDDSVFFESLAHDTRNLGARRNRLADLCRRSIVGRVAVGSVPSTYITTPILSSPCDGVSVGVGERPDTDERCRDHPVVIQLDTFGYSTCDGGAHLWSRRAFHSVAFSRWPTAEQVGF